LEQKACSSKAGKKKKTANGSSRQSRESLPPQKDSSSKEKKRKPRAKKDKENEEKGLSNAALKKARSEIAESQSIDIGKTVSLSMKLLLHGNETDRPIDFNLSVDPETTFKTLKSLITQTTRIPSDKQLLVIKGQEWKMDENGRICDDWSTDDLVAISEECKPSKEFSKTIVPDTLDGEFEDEAGEVDVTSDFEPSYPSEQESDQSK